MRQIRNAFISMVLILSLIISNAEIACADIITFEGNELSNQDEWSTLFSFSSSHPNTHVNTGNKPVDFVEVAKTQIGYAETKTDHTKYNYWFYGNRDVSAQWCAIFVSWCANQAGLSDIIPKFAACKTGYYSTLPAAGGTRHEKSGYLPQKGDIIFLLDNGFSHVGIVDYSDGTYVYYIDGNYTSTNPHSVHYTKRKLSAREITGYITPNYGSQPSGHNPKGNLDECISGEGSLYVYGWAVDEDVPDQSIEVHVYIGDDHVASLTTTGHRTDLPYGGLHGFEGTINTLKVGWQTVKVYAINIASGTNVLIGSKEVYFRETGIDNNPKGSLDECAPEDGAIYVYGWAVDEDDSSQSIEVHVYIDNEFLAALPTTGHRIDVPYDGLHGFQATIPTSKSGKHVINVYGINVGGGTNALIGSKEIWIPEGHTPIGCLDSGEVVDGGVRISGWAVDEDSPSTHLTIRTYIGDTYTDIVTSGHRPDAPYGDTGFHGFDNIIATDKTGVQNVKVYALNVGGGSNCLLGEFVITLPEKGTGLFLHSWYSCDAEDGKSYIPSRVDLDDRVFWNYKITDEAGNIVSPYDYGYGEYFVDLTIYYPDGSVYYTATADNEVNWIAINYNENSPLGTYSGKITIRGSLQGEQTQSWDVYNVAPIIVSQSSNISITQGETATFSVQASGTNLKYKWYVASSLYEEGIEIAGVSGADSPTFSLKNCSLSESGQYFYCKVFNNGNEPVYSKRALLTVVPNTVFYTIQFDANGGVGAPETQYKEENESINISDVIPVRFGYTFMGWAVSGFNTVTHMPGQTYSGDVDLSLKAVWEEAETIPNTLPYTASGAIDVGGAVRYFKFIPTESETYIFESTISEGDVCGYLFDETGKQLLFNDDDGENTNFLISYNLSKGNTYYLAVKWFRETDTGDVSVKISKYEPIVMHTVTYDYATNGGASATKTSVAVESGSFADLSVTAAKSGWEFVGWNTDKNATVALDAYAVTGDTTLYAIYKKAFTVSFYSANNSLQKTATATIYNNETMGKVITPVPKEYPGWTALGWREDTQPGKAKYIDLIFAYVTGNTSFYAVYQRDLTLSYDANGGLTVPSSESVTQFYNAAGITERKEFTVAEAVTKAGCNFSGWALNGINGEIFNPEDSILLSNNATLYATWDEISYNVTYDYATNGGTSATKTNIAVKSGSLADLSVTAAKSGWEFVGWNTDKNATVGLNSYTVTRDVTLYAVYKKVLTTHFYSQKNVLQETKNVTVYNNSTAASVTMPTPSAYDGWTVAGWRDDITANIGEYNAASAYSIGESKIFYAVYSRGLTLSYNANGGDTTPSAQTITQYYNASGNKQSKTFTLPKAVSKDNAVFVGWATNSVQGALYDAGSQISVSDSTIMYAVWEEIDVDPETIVWTVDSNGTLTISGSGAMDNWAASSLTPWYEYKASIKKVVINEGITSIGTSAFEWFNGIESVTIPDSVTTIGSRAFYNCTSLKTLFIPHSVESIGKHALANCESMQKIMVDSKNANYCTVNGVLFDKEKTTVMMYPAQKTDLTEYIIPEMVTKIGYQAFLNNDTLKSIVLPEGLRIIEDFAFSSCNLLSSIDIPAGVTSIGENILAGCYGLTSINVDAENNNYCSDEGVLFDKNKTKLIRYPSHKSVSTYVVPETVTTIAGEAFRSNVYINGIYISESLKTVERYAFGECSKLTAVYYSGTAEDWNNITINTSGNAYFTSARKYYESKPEYTVTYNCLYNGGMPVANKVVKIKSGETADLTYTATKTGWEFIGWNTNPDATEPLLSYVVKDDVTLYAIYQRSFTLTFYDGQITHQKSCTAYNNSSVQTIIPSVSKKEGWTALGWRNNIAADEAQFKEETYYTASSEVKFYAVYERHIQLSYDTGCDAIPPETRILHQYYNAYGNLEEKTIALADAPLRDGYTFAGWTLIAPDSTVYPAGAEITVSNSCVLNATWIKNEEPKDNLCGENVTWKLDSLGVLTIEGSGTMYDFSKTSLIPWYSERLNVKEIVVASGITNIGDRAFYGCINVQKINLPSTVIFIGADAFKNCDEMTIYGEEGTYAEVFANENDIPFVNVKESELKNLTVDFAYTEKKWYFDISVEAYAKQAWVYVALYDAEGTMLAITKEMLVSDDVTSLSLNRISEAVQAKVLVWDLNMCEITECKAVVLPE